MTLMKIPQQIEVKKKNNAFLQSTNHSLIKDVMKVCITKNYQLKKIIQV